MTRSQNLYEIQRYAHTYAYHAERENGGAEFVIDLWGQRLRVMDLVQKAFKPDEADAENPASKVMQLWCGEAISLPDAFMAWKHETIVRKRWKRCLRIPLVRRLFEFIRMWRRCCGPRRSGTHSFGLGENSGSLIF